MLTTISTSVRCRSGSEKLYLALSVDDGLMFCKSVGILQQFLQKLSQEFEIKVNKPNYFVGIKIEQDYQQKTIKIHQMTYIQKLIEKSVMSKAKDCQYNIYAS